MNVMFTLKDELVFFLGVNTGFVRDGIPDDRFLQFYRERSSKKLHCAILGNIVIPGGFGSNSQTPEITTHSRWADVATAISIAGSIAGIQLSTTWSGYMGQRKFVSGKSSQVIEAARQIIKNMTHENIDDVLNGFSNAGRLAIDHGYRHIQVHAAHGYLPSLILDGDINPRAGYAQERVAELVEYFKSQKIETSVRWSMRTGDPEFDRRGIIASVENVTALPFDFIDLSSGYYNIDKRLIYPSTKSFLEQRHSDSLFIAETFPDRRFIVSGKISGLSAKLPKNIDLGICRDLIANPNFLSDWAFGCRNRGKCHYHSRGADRLTCPTWNKHPRAP